MAIMITTLFFVQFIAFQICYLTSGQVKQTDPPGFVHRMLSHKPAFRMLAAALMLLTTGLYITQLGWMTGTCASLVSLMAGSSLVVVGNPFHYVNEKAVAMLYVLFLVLEILI